MVELILLFEPFQENCQLINKTVTQKSIISPPNILYFLVL